MKQKELSGAYAKQSGALTHPGNLRPINEDAILALPEIGLWAVADGMGGHEAGDLASRMIVEDLKRISLRSELTACVSELEQTLRQTHQKILDYALLHLGGKVMGSTLVVLCIRKNRAVCLWAGDSRLYLCRAGQLYAITRDHNRVNELVDSGLFTREQALGLGQSHVITRAVGAGGALNLEQKSISLQPDDIFLLCTDGLSNELSEQEMLQWLGQSLLSAQQKAEGLLNSTLAKAARDNVSVVVVNSVGE